MSDTFSDKLFWPAVVLATLALGGFIYFFATMFSRPQATATSVAVVRREAAPTAPELPANVPALPNPVPVSPEPPAPSQELPAAAMEEDSYIEIPAGKPFLTREDFLNRPKPAPKAPPPKKPLTPPVKPGTPATKPAPAQNAITKLFDKRKVVVMNSGRKIIALTIVDLGDSFGIKDDRNQMHTVKKDDVAKIERP